MTRSCLDIESTSYGNGLLLRRQFRLRSGFARRRQKVRIAPRRQPLIARHDIGDHGESVHELATKRLIRLVVVVAEI